MWDELAGYHSTGEWLKFSGVENGNYYPTSREKLNDLTTEYKNSLNRP
jgi:hypothetical protein